MQWSGWEEHYQFFWPLPHVIFASYCGLLEVGATRPSAKGSKDLKKKLIIFQKASNKKVFWKVSLIWPILWQIFQALAVELSCPGNMGNKERGWQLSWPEELERYHHIWRYWITTRCWIRHLNEEPARANWKRGHAGCGVGSWEMLLLSSWANLRKAHKGLPAGPSQDRRCRCLSLQWQPGGAGSACGSWRHKWVPQRFSAFQKWRASSQ